jgi:hypothetical protein
MSDPQKPKKPKFWQLHLSTAILLMFEAGGLVALNLKRIESDFEGIYFYGWPWPAWHSGNGYYQYKASDQHFGSVLLYVCLDIAIALIFLSTTASQASISSAAARDASHE